MDSMAIALGIGGYYLAKGQQKNDADNRLIQQQLNQQALGPDDVVVSRSGLHKMERIIEQNEREWQDRLDHAREDAEREFRAERESYQEDAIRDQAIIEKQQAALGVARQLLEEQFGQDPDDPGEIS